jgi:hypothetical protein
MKTLLIFPRKDQSASEAVIEAAEVLRRIEIDAETNVQGMGHGLLAIDSRDERRALEELTKAGITAHSN